jgi:hypothetical protein
VLRAGVERTVAHLSLRFVLAGPLARLRIPAMASTPARADRLWEHTCFEAFLAPVGEAAYWEINLSPAGHWNVYRFDGYREGMRPEIHAQAPVGEHKRANCGTLTVRATIDLTAMPALESAALDVGLAAVLESNDEESYWALRHVLRPGLSPRELAVRLPARSGMKLGIDRLLGAAPRDLAGRRVACSLAR